MMMEIIKEFTKTEKNENVKSVQILAWMRRVEAQKTQSAIISKLGETNNVLILTNLFISLCPSLLINLISHTILVTILTIFNFKFTIEILEWNTLLNSTKHK